VATLQSIQVKPVSFRLIHPFITAAGRKTLTQNVQVHITLSDGTRGFGEASTSLAMPEESQQVMERVLQELLGELRGRRIEDYRSLIETCWQLQPYHPTAVASMECALLDAYTRSQGQALYRFFGGARTAVETDLTLSVGGPTKLAHAAKAAAKKGFRKFKVKLAGDSPEKDAERLAAVHKAVRKATLVADGNQGMNMSQALELAKRLEVWGVPLTFLEQPFAKYDLPAMRHFRLRCAIPLFADESVLTPKDAAKVLQSEAADGINVKVAKSGLLGALDIIQIARSARKKLSIGCMEESKLGLAASVHLACGTGAFDWIDLDSAFLLKEPPLDGGFDTKGPKLMVGRIRRGIGVTPSE
jgi:L-alanine-DL-glutamate epimerase-like enolase superfamily enzyme